MKMRLHLHYPTQSNAELAPGPVPDSVRGTGIHFRPAAGRQRASGTTLVETLVATFIAALVLPALYAGLATGFSVVQAAREDLRATQVIVQRMEAVRLSSYKTLKDPTAYPTNCVEYYSESGKTNGTAGAAYTVSYNWTVPPNLYPAYRTNVLLVTVTAAWTSGNVQHSRSMQTYVARYGIQRYVAGSRYL